MERCFSGGHLRCEFCALGFGAVSFGGAGLLWEVEGVVMVRRADGCGVMKDPQTAHFVLTILNLAWLTHCASGDE